jgi:hypothetical protein
VENQSDNNFQDRPRIVETYGAILANGVVLELVATASGDRVLLLRWDGENYETGLQFQDGSTIYCPPFLQPSVFAATRFPRKPAEYGAPTELFWKVVDVFGRYMGFSRELATFMTRVVFCSWFPACCVRPITLCISGLDMDQIMKLFRLLHALCRRPLLVAELSLSLPLILCPTLLVNALTISARAGERWRSSNFHGAFIAGARGTLRNIACSKIIFCETEGDREVWGPEALHIVLLPTSEKLPSLTEQEEAQLAAEFQPQFLMFRLRNLSSMHQPVPSSCQPRSAGFELGGNLPACIADDPEILKALEPMLETRERELLARRALDPHAAILETIWEAAHQGKEVSATQVSKWVNALLRERGEIQEYNPREIGWKLKSLGLDRHDNGNNRVLRFSREMRRRIHQLAAQFGLTLPKVAGCADCGSSQLIVP